MSLCLLRTAPFMHERTAFTKLQPARLIHQYRKQQFESFSSLWSTPVSSSAEHITTAPVKAAPVICNLHQLLNFSSVASTCSCHSHTFGMCTKYVNEYATAMKAPDQMFKQKYGFDKPKPDDPVVFFCTSGSRSYIALRAALQMGYKNFSTSSNCYETQKTSGTSKISADKLLSYEDLVTLIERKEIYLVDVREPHELQETGELPGSINIPLNELSSALKDISDPEFQKKYGAKKPGLKAPLVFSCRSGARSLKALQTALDLGYMKAKHYKGGFLDWAEHKKSKTS